MELPHRAILIVACCHSAKLCAHAARDFPIATLTRMSAVHFIS